MSIIKKLFMTIFHILCGIYIILLSNEIALSYEIGNRRFNYAFIAFVIVFLYTKVVLHQSIKDIGLGTPLPTFSGIMIALLLPIVVSIFYFLMVDGAFVQTAMTKSELKSQVIYAISMGISSGFVEEMVFRGMIMKGIEREWNRVVAIFVPSIFFAIGHMRQIDTNDIVSTALLLVGGTLVGIMFSVVAYQTGSIWTGALIHCMWNIIIIGGIVTVKQEVQSWSPSIWTYVLDTKNVLLTGGKFGIETGIPAIIGYSIVIVISYKWIANLEKKS